MGRTVGIAVGCAGAYIVLVIGLMIYCRSRRSRMLKRQGKVSVTEYKLFYFGTIRSGMVSASFKGFFNSFVYLKNNYPRLPHQAVLLVLRDRAKLITGFKSTSKNIVGIINRNQVFYLFVERRK